MIWFYENYQPFDDIIKIFSSIISREYVYLFIFVLQYEKFSLTSNTMLIAIQCWLSRNMSIFDRKG